ncbi:hypothetical protein RGB73_01980 [Brevibacillus brevis]|uniref:Uncharacterized protein n=1 Tax=Brevibacillus brevis TaxID=1393 RepID=A0ABY9T505_BREBE|nr:hypothetical protein [Brevibacillus brevis]WNC15170.1 hypothetical protein RGB73_01980 [Brevibacillus brevis]
MDDPHQLPVHDQHVGRVFGNIRAGPEGDSDIGRGQCRSVIDPVPDHGDGFPFLLQLFDDLHLFCRQPARVHPLNPGLSGHTPCRQLIVPRDHHDGFSQLFQALDSHPGIVLERIRQSDIPRQLMIDRHQHDDPPLPSMHADTLLNRRDVDVVAVHQLGRTYDDRPVAYVGDDTVSRQRRERGRSRHTDPPALHIGDDRSGQRMLGRGLRRRHQAHELLFFPVCGVDLHDLVLAFGQGAGFVQDDGVHPLQRLQVFALLEQDPQLSRPSGYDQNGHGGGQPERAWTGDDEDRDRLFQRLAKGVGGKNVIPGQKRRDCDRHDDWHENVRHLVCHSLNRSFGHLRFFHRMDHLGQGSLVPDPGRFYFQPAVLVQRRSDDRLPAPFLDRQAFPCEDGLIHRRSAFDNDSVSRDALPWLDDKNIAYSQLRDRYGGDTRGTQDICDLRLQLVELPDRVLAAVFGHRFQVFAQEQKRKNDGAGLVVESRRMSGRRLGGKGDVMAVKKSGGRAEDDEDIHVGCLAFQGMPSPRIKGIADPKLDRQRQGQLKIWVQKQRRDPNERGKGKMSGHRPQKRDGQEPRQEKTAQQVVFFRMRFAFLVRPCLIAELFDSRDDRFVIDLLIVVGDACLVGRQADLHLYHAICPGQYLLDPAGTGCTSHPRDLIRLSHGHSRTLLCHQRMSRCNTYALPRRFRMQVKIPQTEERN